MALIRDFYNHWAQTVTSAVQTVDGCSLCLLSSANEIGTAIKHGDRVGLVQSSIEHAKGYVDGTKYSAVATEKGAALAALFTPVNSKTISLIEKMTALNIIAVLGVAISSLTIILESISIYRQNEVLSVIPKNADLKNKESLSRIVNDLGKVNYNHFKKALPDHLKAKIEKDYGDNGPFEDLKYEIDNNILKNAENFVTEIKDYVSRKRVVHILALIGGIIALAGSVALLVSCPPLLIMVLAIAGLGVTISSVLMTKGWVENPKEGFNWKLCLPEFIQKKLTIEENLFGKAGIKNEFFIDGMPLKDPFDEGKKGRFFW